jgi:hypothetical protein
MSSKSKNPQSKAITLPDTADAQDLSNFSPLHQESGSAAGGEPRHHEAACDSPKAEDPRLVIRGESLEIQDDAGETFKIVPRGSSGMAKVVFIPKAKADGEPWAALTDFLNTTFPFNPSQEKIIELKRYFG